MIFDMQSIFTKYLDKTNKVDNKCDEIYNYTVELEHEFHINIKEKKQTVSLFQQ